MLTYSTCKISGIKVEGDKQLHAIIQYPSKQLRSMSEGAPIIEIIILAVIMGIVMVAIVGVCSVNSSETPNSPLHALNPMCNSFGWIFPNHS